MSTANNAEMPRNFRRIPEAPATADAKKEPAQLLELSWASAFKIGLMVWAMPFILVASGALVAGFLFILGAALFG